MARDCIRHPRHVIQPDHFDGPTVTHERRLKPVPHTWSRDFLRYLRATGSNLD